MKVHGFKHLFHGVLIFSFFMLCFPDFTEASFSYDIEIVEDGLLYFGDFLIIVIFKKLLIFFEMFLTILFAIFLFLICVMFGVIRFESGLFLSIDHKIIGKFMIEMVKIEMREIVFG